MVWKEISVRKTKTIEHHSAPTENFKFQKFKEERNLKVHKRENFQGSDVELLTFS